MEFYIIQDNNEIQIETIKCFIAVLFFSINWNTIFQSYLMLSLFFKIKIQKKQHEPLFVEITF